MFPNITNKMQFICQKILIFQLYALKLKNNPNTIKAQNNTMSEDYDKQFTTDYNEDNALSPNYAVALGYDMDKHNAPVVVAKGQGHIAKKIVQIALDEGIEIHQDADLVQILKAVDIDSEIPLEAFGAVAEIISYIYKANGKMKG